MTKYTAALTFFNTALATDSTFQILTSYKAQTQASQDKVQIYCNVISDYRGSPVQDYQYSESGSGSDLKTMKIGVFATYTSTTVGTLAERHGEVAERIEAALYAYAVANPNKYYDSTRYRTVICAYEELGLSGVVDDGSKSGALLAEYTLHYLQVKI